MNAGSNAIGLGEFLSHILDRFRRMLVWYLGLAEELEEPDDLLPGRADLGAGGLGLRVQSEEDVFQDVEETLVEELGDDVIR